jgi:peroxidase
VAGVSEFKEENSQLGPTFSCILGLQFQHLKFGDRFWYETSDFPANFTPGKYF